MKWFTMSELNDKKYKISPAVKFYCTEALKLSNKEG